MDQSEHESFRSDAFKTEYPDGITMLHMFQISMGQNEGQNNIMVQLGIPIEFMIGEDRQRVVNAHIFKASQLIVSACEALFASDEGINHMLRDAKVQVLCKEADEGYVGDSNDTDPSRLN